jgi:hypothetical protein
MMVIQRPVFLLPLFLFLLLHSCTKAVKTADLKGKKSDTARIMHQLDSLVERMNDAASRQEQFEAMRYCEEGLALELELPDDKKAYGDLHSRYATLLESAGLLSIAQEHFRLAIAGAMNTNPPNYEAIYYKNARLASFLQNHGSADSATYYFRRAIEAGSKHPDKLWLASGYNNLGYLKEELGALDSAALFYNRAEAVLVPKNATDSFLLASIRDNKAHVLMQQQNFSAAETGYRQNQKLYATLHQDNGQVKSLLNASDVFAAAGKYSEALQLADSVHAAFEPTLKQYPGLKQRWLGMRYNLFLKLGREGDALVTLQKLNTIKDSITGEQKRSTEKLMSSAAAGELERHKREDEIRKLQVKQARSESRLSWFIGVTVFFTSMLIIFLLILVSRRRNTEQQNKIKLAEAELRNKQLEGEKLQQELELKKRDLTDMVLFNRHRKEITEGLLAELQEAARADDTTARLKKLIQDLRSRSQAAESIDLVSDNIEEVNKAFFEKLAEQFPELSKGERQLCGLLRLNLSTKDIAQMRRVEPDSVKMAKKRLRKKLGLEPEADLYQFMQKI